MTENEALKRAREIEKNVPCNKPDELQDYLRENPEIIAQTLDELDSLKPAILELSIYLLSSWKFKEILVLGGTRGIEFVESLIWVPGTDRPRFGSRDVDHAIKFLINFGSLSINILERVFLTYGAGENSNFWIHNQRIAAAAALIDLGSDGQKIVERQLNSEDQSLRLIAVHSLCWFVQRQTWEDHLQVANENRRFDSSVERCRKLVPVLLPFWEDKNNDVRERILEMITALKRDDGGFRNEFANLISNEDYFKYLDKGSEDTSREVRNIAFRGLNNLPFTLNTAKIAVRYLEDPDGELSQKIIEHYSRAGWQQGTWEPNVLVDAIFEEIIKRVSGRSSDHFNPHIVNNALASLIERSPRLYTQILKRLCELAFEYQNDVRKRSVFIGRLLNAQEFASLVRERARSDPETASDIQRLLGNMPGELANQVLRTDAANIQQNAANQLLMLERYYEDGLRQAQSSFRVSVISLTIGFLCLIAAIYIILFTGISDIVSIMTVIGSVIAQFISGTAFYLYNQTRHQLSAYNQQMNKVQHYLLANSIAETLEGDTKSKAKLELMRTIAASTDDSNQLIPNSE